MVIELKDLQSWRGYNKDRLTDQLTDYSKQIPSWEASRSPHFIEPEGSLQHSQQPATCPYPKIDSVHA